MFTKRSVLAVAIEATSGTAESLDATDAALNVFDATVTPNVEFIQRPSQGSFGQQKGVIGKRQATITFKTELYGDGAGGVGAWADVLLPCCGFVKATATFSPSGEPPGSNTKTATIGHYVDGRLEIIYGAVGTFKIVSPTAGRVMLEWTFMGVYSGVTDVALLSPTYPTGLPLMAKNATATWGGSSLCFSNINIDAGNVMFVRPCQSATLGLVAGIITDRNVTGDFDPEAQLVATKDLYGDWLASTTAALILAYQDATDKITITAPVAQIVNCSKADRDGLVVDNVQFQCNRSSAAGFDELTILFGAP